MTISPRLRVIKNEADIFTERENANLRRSGWNRVENRGLTLLHAEQFHYRSLPSRSRAPPLPVAAILPP